jgi:hypothetical protein
MNEPAVEMKTPWVIPIMTLEKEAMYCGAWKRMDS